MNWFGRLGRYLLIAVCSFLAGALAFMIYQVRSGPELSLWHTIELQGEYSPKSHPDVSRFDEYLQLEEALFAELDTQIYAKTESGLAYDLARYSNDSAADPRQRKPNWNRSYLLPGKPDADGVLLVHGMSDSPYSLRVLAETLQQRGYWVLGIRLPGHGTIPSGLRDPSWEDMAAAVTLGMQGLRQQIGTRPVHLVGYSVGAALAVDYALEQYGSAEAARAVAPENASAGASANRSANQSGSSSANASVSQPMNSQTKTPASRLASLVLISPALGITPAARFAGWLDDLAVLPGMEKLAWQDTLPEFDPYKYNSFTRNAGYQVHRLINDVNERMDALTDNGPLQGFPPTLVFMSAADATVSVNAVLDKLLLKLASETHELMLFDVNRSSVQSTILVEDPGPLTARLMADGNLPFTVSLITNESTESSAVELRRKLAGAAEVNARPLGLSWPSGLISLSHIALQFPPNDSLYGRAEYRVDQQLHLGQMDFQGERGLLKFPSSWLLRVRYNPFHRVFESRVLDWFDGKDFALR